MRANIRPCIEGLTDREKGVVRNLQQTRNQGAYENPKNVNPALAAGAYNLARKMLNDARACRSA